MNYAWWKQCHVKVSIRFYYVVLFFFQTHIITKAYPYAWRQKFIMAFHFLTKAETLNFSEAGDTGGTYE